MSASDTDIALAHWGEYANGGGERVAWDLHRALDAPLYVSYRNPEIEPEDVTTTGVRVSTPVTWALKRGGLARLLAHQHIWQVRPELDAYDTIITSGNEPLAYVPRDGQAWIAYTHHTSRMATDLLHSYVEKHDTLVQAPIKFGKIWVRWVERQIYTNYATKPDRFVANSELVARRIHRYWGVPRKKIDVIYPMVETDVELGGDGGYYLLLSRLYPEKRIVEAAEQVLEATVPTGRVVKIAGAGPQADAVDALAEETDTDRIDYLGYVDEDDKHRLYANASAVIFNARGEDFGLVPIEAMAHGTPVLGVDDGFTRYQIPHGRAGYVYERRELAGAIERFEREGVAWGPETINEFVDINFGPARFERQLREVIDRVREEVRLEPSIRVPQQVSHA